jgi:hypothetical protein
LELSKMSAKGLQIIRELSKLDLIRYK